MDEYLIWSNERRGWWKANRHGYTLRIDEAARFSETEAQKIAADGNRGLAPDAGYPNEMVVQAPDRGQWPDWTDHRQRAAIVHLLDVLSSGGEATLTQSPPGLILSPGHVLAGARRVYLTDLPGDQVAVSLVPFPVLGDYWAEARQRSLVVDYKTGDPGA